MSMRVANFECFVHNPPVVRSVATQKKKKKKMSEVMVVGMDSGVDNDDKGIAERLCVPKGGRGASDDYDSTRAITRRRCND